MHDSPTPRFWRRHGFYYPLCRSQGVPRFRCSSCGRTFSRQTFRMDYRDHRPDLNLMVFLLLCSGLGLRQTARLVGMTENNTVRKFRKIGRHCRLLNANLMRKLPVGAVLQFDELETYEGRRSTRPLTLPILIERGSRMILAARSAPIRPSGTMPPSRLRAIQQDETRFKRRQSRSRAAVRSVLRKAADLFSRRAPVVLESDEKSTYPAIGRRVFGDRLVHRQTPSRLARGTWNPLFPINHTEAMARDLIGRLRRESWLVSKCRWFLNLQLQIYIAYRNFVRPRFNKDRLTPGELIGWLRRRLTPGQVLSWRQDFGSDSGHPLSRHGRAIRHVSPAA